MSKCKTGARTRSRPCHHPGPARPVEVSMLLYLLVSGKKIRGQVLLVTSADGYLG